MEVEIKKHPDKSVLILSQNVKIGSDAAVIQNAVLDSIQAGSKAIVVDLSRLKYITSWGIGTLFHALTTCRKQDVEFFEPSELRLRFRGSPNGKAEAKI